MVAQAPPSGPSPPPIPPGIDPNLNNYLQQFSFWAAQGFAATLSSNQALSGVLLRANDAPAGASPATYQLAADTAGELQTRLIASGSGAAGSWTTVGGREGVTDGSDAPAGVIGEYVSAPSSGSLANGVTTTIGAMSLSAGDWDVEGLIQFSFSGILGQDVVVGVSTVPGSFPALGETGRAQLNTAANTLNIVALPTGAMRVSVATPINVYLVGLAVFSSGTCSALGFMRARRMR
jgi:hypothetical protein